MIRGTKLAIGSVDRFVVPSRWAAGQLARLGVPADRLDVLPHYLPAQELADGSRADEGTYLLAAGRLAPEKGLDVAIEAARLAEVPLWIAGDGPAVPDLTALIERTRAPVRLIGAVDRYTAFRFREPSHLSEQQVRARIEKLQRDARAQLKVRGRKARLHVLLTGATGFLGKEILAQSEEPRVRRPCRQGDLVDREPGVHLRRELLRRDRPAQ